jgi:hypothetical protein
MASTPHDCCCCCCCCCCWLLLLLAAAAAAAAAENLIHFAQQRMDIAARQPFANRGRRRRAHDATSNTVVVLP